MSSRFEPAAAKHGRSVLRSFHEMILRRAVCFLPLLCLIAASPAWAAETRIQGVVVNGATGRPVAHQDIQLLWPTQDEVRQVAVVETDAQGRYLFDRTDLKTASFYLLQAPYQGVNYNEPVQFNARGIATANFKVYDSTAVEPHFRVKSARFLIRARGDVVQVEELYALENDTNPPLAYVNPNGTFFFQLGKAAGPPTVAVAGEMNLALPQQAERGSAPGQFFIKYPMKPGLTVVMVAYEADYSGQSFSLADSVPYPIDQIEMDVKPAALEVSSPLFEAAGPGSEADSRKLAAVDVKPGEILSAVFQGAPMAPAPSDQGQESGTVKELPNPTTRLGWPLLGCFLLVLLWALGVRVSKEWTHKGQGQPGSPALKELEARLEKLLDSLANLDELFEEGKIPEKKYWRERLDLKARIVVLLRKTPPTLLESYGARHNPH
jgi:hypothetical protein